MQFGKPSIELLEKYKTQIDQQPDLFTKRFDTVRPQLKSSGDTRIEEKPPKQTPDASIENPTSEQEPNSHSALYWGAPIWGNKAWKGSVYPEKAPQRKFLHFYSKVFNSIELNSSFYAMPPESTIRGWLEQTDSSFKFCPKVVRAVSHGAITPDSIARFKNFFEEIKDFGPKLGIPFLQFSEKVSPDQIHSLHELLTVVPKQQTVAIELRHPAWFKNHQPIAIFDQLLERFPIVPVITDSLGRADLFHLKTSQSIAFVRFTANDLHPTDLPRLKEWVSQIEYWIKNGVSEIYFFIHSPDDTHFPKLAFDFSNLLESSNALQRFVLRAADNAESSSAERPQMTLF